MDQRSANCPSHVTSSSHDHLVHSELAAVRHLDWQKIACLVEVRERLTHAQPLTEYGKDLASSFVSVYFAHFRDIVFRLRALFTFKITAREYSHTGE